MKKNDDLGADDKNLMQFLNSTLNFNPSSLELFAKIFKMQVTTARFLNRCLTEATSQALFKAYLGIGHEKRREGGPPAHDAEGGKNSDVLLDILGPYRFFWIPSSEASSDFCHPTPFATF